MRIEPGTTFDHPALVVLWERSVRATHDFLREEDIVFIRGLVETAALASLDLWVMRDGEGALVGFLGLSGNSVEALFIDPDHFGRGAGRKFLDFARDLRGPLYVDVNEQNPGALAFYERYGFRRVGRSPVDSAGHPFPLLHLAMPGATHPHTEGKDA